MNRTTRLVTGTLVIAAMSATLTGGGRPAHAAGPAGHALARVNGAATLVPTVSSPSAIGNSSTLDTPAPAAPLSKLDYRLIQHYGATMTISDEVVMTDTNDVLSGKAHNIQQNCDAAINGTLRSGKANFSFRYIDGVCKGRVVAFVGQLGLKKGAGTFTTNGGSKGTWNAGDIT